MGESLLFKLFKTKWNFGFFAKQEEPEVEKAKENFVPLAAYMRDTSYVRIDAENARKRAEELAEKQKLAAEAIRVKRFLDAVKVSFEHDIKRGEELPASVFFPDDPAFDTHRFYRSGHLHWPNGLEMHPHYELFVDFFEWVKRNYLYVGFVKNRYDETRWEVRCWAYNPKVKDL